MQLKLGHNQEKFGHKQKKLGHHNLQMTQGKEKFGKKIVRPQKVRTKTGFFKNLGHVKFGLVTLHQLI